LWQQKVKRNFKRAMQYQKMCVQES